MKIFSKNLIYIWKRNKIFNKLIKIYFEYKENIKYLINFIKKNPLLKI